MFRRSAPLALRFLAEAAPRRPPAVGNILAAAAAGTGIAPGKYDTGRRRRRPFDPPRAMATAALVHLGCMPRVTPPWRQFGAVAASGDGDGDEEWRTLLPYLQRRLGLSDAQAVKVARYHYAARSRALVGSEVTELKVEGLLAFLEEELEHQLQQQTTMPT